jgi:hypothetical protein
MNIVFSSLEVERAGPGVSDFDSPISADFSAAERKK